MSLLNSRAFYQHMSIFTIAEITYSWIRTIQDSWVRINFFYFNFEMSTKNVSWTKFINVIIIYIWIWTSLPRYWGGPSFWRFFSIIFKFMFINNFIETDSCCSYWRQLLFLRAANMRRSSSRSMIETYTHVSATFCMVNLSQVPKILDTVSCNYQKTLCSAITRLNICHSIPKLQVTNARPK